MFKCLKKEKKPAYDGYTGPRDLSDNKVANVYIDDMEKAFKNKDIHNIALSGWYGSGKSSIIYTFMKRKGNSKKSLVVSFGSILSYNFDDCNCSNVESQEDENDNAISLKEYKVVDRIEKSILKQILHYNFSEEMPRSSIKRVYNKYFDSLMKYIFIFLFTNILVLLLCCNNYIYNFLISLTFFHPNMMTINIYFYILMFLLLIYVSYLYGKFIKINLKKIKMKDSELEFGLLDSLAFNHFIYEILYFFQKNKVRYVFFEDIDRFSNDIVIMLMEELKELNSIINSSAFMRGKNGVKFVYEFKDDMFSKYEWRNKFYDYVISIMPLSTVSNSYLHFYEIFKDTNVDLEILRIVSKYIVDYRTILNVRHDFNNFTKIIRSEEEINKIFATCCYKNYYIKEYSNIINSISDLEDNIIDTAEIINDVDDFYDNSRSSLITLRDNLIKFKQLRDSNEEIEDDDLKQCFVDDNFFVKKIKGSKNLDIDTMFSLFNQYYSKISGDIKYFDSSFLSEMRDIFKTKYNHKENNVDLLIDLSLCGAFDSHFVDYISSPVITDDLKINDNRYIMRINHKLDAKNIAVENPSSIIKYIQYDDDFKLKNYSLMNYVFDNEKDNKKFKERLLSEFNIITREEIDYIIKYDSNPKNQKKLIDILASDYDFIIKLNNFMTSNSSYINDKLSDIINVLLMSEKNDEIIKNSKMIYDSICSYKFEINFYNEYIVNNLKKIGILFLRMKKHDSNIIEYDYNIYKNSLYKMNKYNIDYIQSQNYYNEKTLFKKHMLNNLDDFYNNYYMDNDFDFGDNDYLNEVLSTTKNDDFKKAIIKRENIIVLHLTPDICATVLENDRINHTWNDLIPAIKMGFYKETCKFVIKNLDDFSKKILKIDDINFNNMLVKQLLDKNNIDCVNLYLKKNYVEQNIYNITEKMGVDTINYMIDNKLCSFNKDNLKSIAKKCDKNHIDVYLIQLWNGIGNNISRFTRIIKTIDNLDLSNFLKYIGDFQKNYQTICEFLIKLDLDSTQLAEKYSIFMDKRRNYIIPLKYKDLFMENEFMFKIEKIDRKNIKIRYLGNTRELVTE